MQLQTKLILKKKISAHIECHHLDSTKVHFHSHTFQPQPTNTASIVPPHQTFITDAIIHTTDNEIYIHSRKRIKSMINNIKYKLNSKSNSRVLVPRNNTIIFVKSKFICNTFFMDTDAVDVDCSEDVIYILYKDRLEVLSDVKEVFFVDGNVKMVRVTEDRRVVVLCSDKDVFKIMLDTGVVEHVLSLFSNIFEIGVINSRINNKIENEIKYEEEAKRNTKWRKKLKKSDSIDIKKKSIGIEENESINNYKDINDNKELLNLLKSTITKNGPEYLFVLCAKRLTKVDLRNLNTKSVYLNSKYKMNLHPEFVILNHKNSTLFINHSLNSYYVYNGAISVSVNGNCISMLSSCCNYINIINLNEEYRIKKRELVGSGFVADSPLNLQYFILNIHDYYIHRLYLKNKKTIKNNLLNKSLYKFIKMDCKEDAFLEEFRIKEDFSEEEGDKLEINDMVRFKEENIGKVNEYKSKEKVVEAENDKLEINDMFRFKEDNDGKVNEYKSKEEVVEAENDKLEINDMFRFKEDNDGKVNEYKSKEELGENNIFSSDENTDILIRKLMLFKPKRYKIGPKSKYKSETSIKCEELNQDLDIVEELYFSKVKNFLRGKKTVEKADKIEDCELMKKVESDYRIIYKQEEAKDKEKKVERTIIRKRTGGF